MSWSVAMLCDASGGERLQGDPDRRLAGIATDSRRVERGDCFVPLRGERFDGHDFIPSALERGAGAIVVERGRPPRVWPGDVAVIAVADTLEALGRLAAHWRRRHQGPVVGITGSNGKTSTKEMLARILAQRWNVLRNPGNFNNLIGVPLTLLDLRPHHEAAVVEMGINIPGEMARLVEIVQPNVGLVTNIHPAHLAGLKSPEEILREKGKLLECLGPGDLALINRDDPLLQAFSAGLKARQLAFAMRDPGAQVHIEGDICMTGEGSVFQLVMDGERCEVRLPVVGIHQVQNALAAAAAAHGLGLPAEAVAVGLAQHRPVAQRMQLRPLPDGTRIVDDTYNANPMSMVAAVEAVAAVRSGLPLVAVLGEMRELGEQAAELHRQVGRRIGAVGVDRLVTLGDLAEWILRGAVEAGLDTAQCAHATSHEDAVGLVKSWWPAGGWILVKGSRGMRMEKVVEGIVPS
jgi:UDP-N-acetylmuramoyl-tripeptide--D-alanyl-D-alanine ligase